VNRNTVSGALNVLQVSGQVEVREIGPARVFYLSNKVPISSILNISDDCIAVVNSNGNIVQINDSCIEIIGLSRAELLDKPYHNLFSLFSFDSIFAGGTSDNNNVTTANQFAAGTAGSNPRRLTVLMRWSNSNSEPAINSDWDNGGLVSAGSFVPFEYYVDLKVDSSGRGTGVVGYDGLGAVSPFAKWVQFTVVVDNNFGQ
jgi:hypothetical protein